MTNKRKKRIRALSEKTGMSYQAAHNASSNTAPLTFVYSPDDVRVRIRPGASSFKERLPLDFFLRDTLPEVSEPLYHSEGMASWALGDNGPIRLHDERVPLHSRPLTDDDAWSVLLAAAKASNNTEMFDILPWGTVRRGGVTLIVGDPEYVARRPTYPDGRQGLVFYNPGGIIMMTDEAYAASSNQEFQNQLDLAAADPDYALFNYPIHWTENLVIRGLGKATEAFQLLSSRPDVTRVSDAERLRMGVVSGGRTLWFSMSVAKSVEGFGAWWLSLKREQYHDTFHLSEYLRELSSDSWPIWEKCDRKEAERRATIHRTVENRIVLKSVDDNGVQIGYSTFSVSPTGGEIVDEKPIRIDFTD